MLVSNLIGSRGLGRRAGAFGRDATACRTCKRGRKSSDERIDLKDELGTFGLRNSRASHAVLAFRVSSRADRRNGHVRTCLWPALLHRVY